MFSRSRVSLLGAEFIGTGTLALVALVLINTTAASYFIATSLAFAVALVVMLFNGVSGAHLNPAITFGMWTARRIPTLQAVSYVGAQLLGGLGAWQLYQYLVGKPIPAHPSHFDTSLWLAQVAGTFILSMGVTAAVTRGLDSLQSAIVTAGSFFTGIMIASITTIGLLNPAIALSLRSWSSVDVLGPLVGAVLGVNLYLMLFAPVRAGRSKK